MLRIQGKKHYCHEIQEIEVDQKYETNNCFQKLLSTIQRERLINNAANIVFYGQHTIQEIIQYWNFGC